MDFRSFAQKKQFVCRENARRVSFLLDCQLGLRQFFNLHFFSQIFAQIKANKSFFSVELGWPENCSEQKLVLRIGKV